MYVSSRLYTFVTNNRDVFYLEPTPYMEQCDALVNRHKMYSLALSVAVSMIYVCTHVHYMYSAFLLSVNNYVDSTYVPVWVIYVAYHLCE